MANNLDTATLLSIAKNRNKLMRLAEGIKSRKKPGNKKSLNLKRDPAYTNIEHLVFGTYRPRAATPESEQYRNDPSGGGSRRHARNVTSTNSEIIVRDNSRNMSPHRKAARDVVVVESKMSVENEEKQNSPLQPIKIKENVDGKNNSDSQNNHLHWKVSLDSNCDLSTEDWKIDSLVNDSVFTDGIENLEPSICTWNLEGLDNVSGNQTDRSVNCVKVDIVDATGRNCYENGNHYPRQQISVHNRTVPVAENKNETEKFSRQNTYPSGIPRPRIHVKHTLTPVAKLPQQEKCPKSTATNNISARRPLNQETKKVVSDKSRSNLVRTSNNNRSSLSADSKLKSSSKSSLSSSHSSLSGNKANTNQIKKIDSNRSSGFVRSQSYCRVTDKPAKSSGVIVQSNQARRGTPRSSNLNKFPAVTKQTDRPLIRKHIDRTSVVQTREIQQNRSTNQTSHPKSIPRPEGTHTERGSRLPFRVTQNDNTECFRRPVRSVSVDSGKVLNSLNLQLSTPEKTTVRKPAFVRSSVSSDVVLKCRSSVKKSTTTVDMGTLSLKNVTPEQIQKPKCDAQQEATEAEDASETVAENVEKSKLLMSDIEEKEENSASTGTSKTTSEEPVEHPPLPRSYFGRNRQSNSLPNSFLLERYGLNGHKVPETKSGESLGLERLLQIGETTQVSVSPTLVRRRAASASESSPKTKPPPRPHSDVGSSLNGNSSIVEAFMAQLSRQRDTVPELKHHLSDSGTPLRKTPSVERQLSTPSFIKMRTDRSRPLKRNRGQSRLRRSISQPLDLEKIGANAKQLGLSDHEGSRDISTASSEDDFSSDGESCNNPHTPLRTQPLFREFSDDGVTYAEALWDHVTIVDAEELAFQAGEVIEVTDSSDKDWWWGSIGARSGWFPAAFVRLRVNQENTVEDCISKMSDGTLMQQTPRKMTVSLLSNEQVRANVVQEIISTERDFVQHLKDVVEGYLRQVRRRSDMFSEDRIATIFGNIQEIYSFQSRFLKHLEACIDNDRPHLSQIGNCFLQHKEEFEIYSEYCNNHPLAVSELQELYADSKYIQFFEACRLLQEMIDISLDGFLLTPVQKICKYPLQLAELLKYTKVDHPDHQPVTKALAAMREVAQLVNERKRRMECLEKLTEWQQSVDGWEGPDLLDTSSMLLHSGEITRASSTWSRDVIQMFLFDHLLVYCKKDMLKRNTYVYKGRIDLDNSCVIDLEDGRDSQFGMTVKNAWKVYCAARDKWFLFYTKTSTEKEQWLHAFEEERTRVNEDKLQGYVVTEEAKKASRLAVINKFKPKRPRAKLPKSTRPHPDTAVAELLLDPPEPKSRTGSLPSNLHPSVAVTENNRHGPPKKKGSGWFHFGSSKKPKKKESPFIHF